jgi:hypothetical protein
MKTKGLICEHCNRVGVAIEMERVDSDCPRAAVRLLASRLDSVGESDDTERLMTKSVLVCWVGRFIGANHPSVRRKRNSASPGR